MGTGSFRDAITGRLYRCLNIGCGQDVKPFWVNCDANPVSDKVRKFDINSEDDLEWLKIQNADIIQCYHVIGYLNLGQALRFFRATYSALRIGGKFILEFPDLRKIALMLLNSEQRPINEVDYVEIIRAIYAYDIKDAYDVNFFGQTYVFGWTTEFLKAKLKECGFKTMESTNPQSHGNRVLRDSRVVVTK